MKKLAAALLLACALIFATTAQAVDFETGLKQNVMTVRWRPSEPLATPDEAALDRAVPAAIAAGLDVVFAVYPYPPSEIESGSLSPADFAAWLDALARRYPDVTTYIVGNEPNLNTFWRAQGNGAGKILSGATFGPFLAAGYDALKSVSSGIKVLDAGRGRQVVACPLPPLARRVVPREQPADSADGRVQLPSLPESERLLRSVLVHVRLAERGHPGARADQAGALGRVQRDAAADDGQRREALSRRGRLAGRHWR